MSDGPGRSAVELTFLALAGEDYEIGIPAERVREIVAAVDWHGEPALDVSDLIPALAGSAAERVLAIGLAGAGLLPLRTTSTIAVRTVDAAALVGVPRVVTRRARWIRGIVFGDKAMPLVVIDPEAIADRSVGAAATIRHFLLEELW
jgi:hypothetical protein